jgi:trigger factor
VQVTIEKVGTALAKVLLTVPKEEFAKEFNSGLLHVGRNMRVKGFRPGKIPARMIEQQHGEQVRNEVRENFLRRAYQKAVEDEGLKPLSAPRVAFDDMVGDESTDLEVSFEINLRPEAILPDLDNMTIESQLEPVVDEAITNTIEDIKRQQATPDPAGDAGIDENGIVVCNVSFLHGEDVVFEREGLRLGPQTAPPGIDPEAFKDAMLGAKEKDTIQVDMTLDDNLDNEAQRGQPGTCRLEVLEAFNMTPPTDEKLLELLGASDEADMKTKVRERLAEALQQREDTRIESALLKQVIDATPLDLPEPMVEEQTVARLGQLRERLDGEGLDEEKIQAQLDEQKDTARDEAEAGLKALLIVEAIGQAKELLVTQEDMDQELTVIAERNDASVDEVKKYYAENNLGQQIAIELLERKVRLYLREHATLQTPG